MKKQKICIIGDGLSGLTTALILKKLDVNIDIYYSKKSISLNQDIRTTAISNSNLNFLKESLGKINNRIFWPCNEVKLYYEHNEKYSNFLNINKNKHISMHIVENQKFRKVLLNKLKVNNVRFINKKVDKINVQKEFIQTNKVKAFYDIIILCLGSKSNFYQELTDERSIKKDYHEVAISGTVKHNIKLNNSIQYFFKEGPFAILPFKEKYLSFVWSLNKSFYNLNKKKLDNLIKKKLDIILGAKKRILVSKISSYPLYMNLQTRYYKKNFLILGEGLHSIHPIAGQGFNLFLRDIKKLYENIKSSLELGLPLKNSLILKNFSDSRKPENTILSIGIDLTNSFFKKNNFLDFVKFSFLKRIKDSKRIKNLSTIISDSGFNK
jgi:2-octaprenyl-6-methoxyphenol hydroxylase